MFLKKTLFEVIVMIKILTQISIQHTDNVCSRAQHEEDSYHKAGEWLLTPFSILFGRKYGIIYTDSLPGTYIGKGKVCNTNKNVLGYEYYDEAEKTHLTALAVFAICGLGLVGLGLALKSFVVAGAIMVGVLAAITVIGALLLHNSNSHKDAYQIILKAETEVNDDDKHAFKKIFNDNDLKKLLPPKFQQVENRDDIAPEDQKKALIAVRHKVKEILKRGVMDMSAVELWKLLDQERSRL